MADEPEAEYVPETPELFVGDGEFWLADAVSFCKTHKAEGFLSVNGNVFALVDGKGWINVEDLVKGKRGAAVRSIGGTK